MLMMLSSHWVVAQLSLLQSVWDGSLHGLLAWFQFGKMEATCSQKRALTQHGCSSLGAYYSFPFVAAVLLFGHPKSALA
jgi:hypothetical protein